MIGRLAVGLAAVILPAAVASRVLRRGADRLLDAPRALPEEAGLGPALDALGGEVVRLRARDGVRLAGRWLPAESTAEPASTGAPTAPSMAEGGSAPAGVSMAWRPAADEAILLLHGYSGSVTPDLVEYGPFLRRTAAVLGLDFRGHGDSEPAPTTFGLFEVEDVGGALAWLGERGVRRVALLGTSMGGMTAIAATAILGDGRLAAADADPAAPRFVTGAPRPEIVGIVADSVAPDLVTVVANRIRGPGRRLVAGRLFGAAARRLGADPRSVEPERMLPLLEDLPVLLIHGEADTTVPPAAARRLAAAGGPGVEAWSIAGAEHSAGHRAAPAAYEARVGAFLRQALRPPEAGPRSP